MRSFEATVTFREEDINRALIKALSDAMMYRNHTEPEVTWSVCPIIIDGNQRNSYISSFTADASEVTDVTLRVFGEEGWQVTLTLDAGRKSFIGLSTITVADK